MTMTEHPSSPPAAQDPPEGEEQDEEQDIDDDDEESKFMFLLKGFKLGKALGADYSGRMNADETI